MILRGKHEKETNCENMRVHETRNKRDVRDLPVSLEPQYEGCCLYSRLPG